MEVKKEMPGQLRDVTKQRPALCCRGLAFSSGSAHALVPLKSLVVLQKPLQYSDCWGFPFHVEKYSLEQCDLLDMEEDSRLPDNPWESR